MNMLRVDPRRKAICLQALMWVCLLGMWGVPGRAGAQDYAAAGRAFEEAQDAYGKGKYAEAAQKYQAAYDITKDAALLVNIGESWQRAGGGGKAVVAYRAYLQAQPAAGDRAEIEKR